MNDAEKLNAIRALHSPLVPPKGQKIMFSKKNVQYCEECLPDDPFYSVEWPCDTRKITDGQLTFDDGVWSYVS